MKKLILIFFLGPVFLFSGHEIDNRKNRIAGIDTLQQIKRLNELAIKFLNNNYKEIVHSAGKSKPRIEFSKGVV